jgi:hypothetical protein
MRKLKSSRIEVNPQINWDDIRKRMILNGYQIGYKTSTPTPTPVDNWILTTGVWNDSGEWQDDDNWKDS